MSREDPFIVRSTTLTGLGDGNRNTAVVGRHGLQVTVDFYTQMVLAGFTYHMQNGVENAPIAGTAVIDDELVWMLVDNPAGKVLIPTFAGIHVALWSTSTLTESMLELDKDKARFISGGTAYVPANLRTDDPNAASGTFIVGTDILTSAASAVPNTVELARITHSEDNIATSVGSDAANQTLYSVHRDSPVMLVDASSVLFHHGASADTSSYGNLEFIQADKGVFVAT